VRDLGKDELARTMVNEVMITSVYKVDIRWPGNVWGEWAVDADIAVVGVKEHVVVDLSEHFGGDVIVDESVGRKGLF
jgi:hypothetical protein